MVSLSKIIEEEYADVARADITSIRNNSDLDIAKKIIAKREELMYGAFFEGDHVEKIFGTVYEETHFEKKDIINLCYAISEYQDIFKASGKNDFSDFGYILSQLINIHHKITRENDYLIKTDHLIEPLSYLGFENNGAHIIIKGNTGYDTCKNMKSGTVEIFGNALSHFGYRMRGGNVILNGNAEDRVGEELIEGTIEIKGSVKNHLGNQASGGTIIVEKNAGAFVGSEMGEAKIIVKGDCDNVIGDSQQGGEITIFGNAGFQIGYCLQNGKITLHGNTKDYVGDSMQGGEIHLHGEYGGISPRMYRGNIFHKGMRMSYPNAVFRSIENW